MFQIGDHVHSTQARALSEVTFESCEMSGFVVWTNGIYSGYRYAPTVLRLKTANGVVYQSSVSYCRLTARGALMRKHGVKTEC